jgi:hypothetical protein
MYAWYFYYFYATMVNVLMGLYTLYKVFTWGLRFFYSAIMKILFSFLNAMLMQKSKNAKVKKFMQC